MHSFLQRSGRLVLAIAACAAASVEAQSPPAADASAGRGKLLFLRCASCHEVEDRGLVKAGPTLRGVYGRPAAAVSGYGYSPALRAKAGALVWDAATLDRWLEQPTNVVPETSMAFVGMPSEAERKALIAYLQTLK